MQIPTGALDKLSQNQLDLNRAIKYCHSVPFDY